MADRILQPVSPLAGAVGSVGATPPTLRLDEVTGLAIVSLAVRRGRANEVAAALHDAYGIDWPAVPARVVGRGLSVVWSGPGQALCIADASDGDLETILRARLGTAASVADQSDGRIVLRLAGARSRDVLAKGFAIDLHPRTFRPGSAAVTSCAGIGVQFWQVDDVPTYELCMFRSYARDLHAFLMHAGAEFGIAVGQALGGGPSG